MSRFPRATVAGRFIISPVGMIPQEFGADAGIEHDKADRGPAASDTA
jgi:hypothetical protein